jgi:uncharacterized membrane protein
MTIGVGLSFLTKVLSADDGKFVYGPLDTTLFLASVWLIGVCIITMIFAGINGLHRKSCNTNAGAANALALQSCVEVLVTTLCCCTSTAGVWLPRNWHVLRILFGGCHHCERCP